MKRVLITGGSRGIGAAMVKAFRNEGYRVAFLYHSNHAAAADVAAKTGALPFCCDVSDPVALQAYGARSLRHLTAHPRYW